MKDFEVYLNRIFFYLTGILFLLSAPFLHARPEYAARHNYVNCQLCHVSPFGGGARNINGKFYGSHEYPFNSFSKQDLVSFETRLEAFYSKGAATTRGLFFMTADPTFNIPLTQGEDGKSLDRFVFSLGLAPLESKNNKEREGYFLHEFAKPGEEKYFSTLSLGRFLLPFGLMTDEHRTYTKLQTKTSNFDYEMGVGLTGDPHFKFHWDFALTGGSPAQGGSSPILNDSPYGALLNFRYHPLKHPGFFGLSYYTLNSDSYKKPMEAYSIYNVVSLESLLNRPIQWQLELTYADGFSNPQVNTYMNRFFIPSTDTAWNDTLKDAKSYGVYSLLSYELNSRWQLQYKYDQFIPDNRYLADSFSRNSAGIKHFLNSNMDVNFRLEQSNSTRPGLTEEASLPTVVNSAFVLLHGWL